MGKDPSCFDWAGDPPLPVPPSCVVILTGWLHLLKKVREKGERESRLIPRFPSQIIRWMELTTDDGFPERKHGRTDKEKEIMVSVLSEFVLECFIASS